MKRNNTIKFNYFQNCLLFDILTCSQCIFLDEGWRQQTWLTNVAITNIEKYTLGTSENIDINRRESLLKAIAYISLSEFKRAIDKITHEI